MRLKNTSIRIARRVIERQVYWLNSWHSSRTTTSQDWRCDHAAMDDNNCGRTALRHAAFQRASVSHGTLRPNGSSGSHPPDSSSSRGSGIRLAGRLLPLDWKPLSLGSGSICSSTLCGGALGPRAVASFESGLVLDRWSLETLAN